LQGADAVILALRSGVLKGVIEEIADAPTDKLVVVPSNPVGLGAPPPAATQQQPCQRIALCGSRRTIV
jgi:predicted dinucleotide-binding enzyme